jgi:hypothetical protein
MTVSNKPPGLPLSKTFLLGAFLLMLWFGPPIYLVWIKGTTWAAEAGSAFGITSSLFSGLAILGAVYSVILQRNQLRRSLEHAEGERHRSSLALALNCATALIQQTEKRIHDLDPSSGQISSIRQQLEERKNQYWKQRTLQIISASQCDELIKLLDHLIALHAILDFSLHNLEALNKPEAHNV